MRRLFGSSKPKEKATIDGAITIMDKQSNYLEERVVKINSELRVLNTQMQNATTQHAKGVIKNKVLRLLKQRKQYEKQLEILQQQTFNLDNVNYTVSSTQNAIMMCDAMTASAKAVKHNMRKINIEKVESITDNMRDLMEEVNEINSLLGDTYNEEIYDEDDLMAEFEDLEVMCADETKTGKLLDDIGITKDLDSIVLPFSDSRAAYDKPTTANINSNSSIRQPIMVTPSNSKKNESNNGIKVDEFGLPIE